MKMNWWDKVLMGFILWIMRRWFIHCIVGYDKEENVVYIEFSSNTYRINTTTFQAYDAK